MIYIETDDDELCGEMLASYHERKTINVCGKDIAMSQISRNVLVSGGVSVEVKGGICITPAWSDEGKPPVGELIEALWSESGDVWLKTIVFAFNEHGQPIHRWEEGQKKYEYQASPLVGMGSNKPYFRPIRTPEQIAADERKSEITFMASCIAHSNCRHAPTDHDIAAAAHLHYLGYRKP